MNKDDLYYNNQTPVDNKLYPKKIDNIMAYGKAFEPKIDPRTDYGRGIVYKTGDGKYVATMEEVRLYNQMYYDSMMKKSVNDYTEDKGMHR